MSKRNLGRFIISNELMRDDEAMLQIQQGLAVLNVQQDLMMRRCEFLAVGDMFEPVTKFELPPIYDAEIQQIKDGFDIYYRVKFKRREVQS